MRASNFLPAFFLPFSFLTYLLPVIYGATQPPTLRLPDTVAPTSYRVDLKLDPTSQTFSGFIAIQVDVKQGQNVIWLNGIDLTISDAMLKSGGKTLNAKPVSGGTDFIGLQFDSDVPAGNAELDIHYSGKVRQQDTSGVFHMSENGVDYLFTQFESTDARAAFPCFDEPSYKVPWQLSLNVPASEVAVSNTPVVNEENKGDRKVFQFKQTKPLPSYLVAFAVGQFDFVPAGTAGRNHYPVRIVTPKGHAEDAKYAAEITSTILDRLENYFGIPFPYEKSDQLAIPVTFGFGAMENAGLVTYAQTILLGNPKRDTITRQRECASVEAHELAHQWFGDFVTTAWWNDIWLNEAFATWTEQKIIAEWKPEWDTRTEDVYSKLYAEREDSLISARKVRQEIVSKNDISNAFDAITYQKGAAVIGMFEHWVGSKEFQAGVHSYLEQHAFKNATAPEFLAAIAAHSSRPVEQPFSSFLNQAGVPMVSVALDCKNQSQPVLHMSQQRFLPLGAQSSGTQTWQIPVCVRYGSGDSGQSACTLLSQPSSDWSIKGNGCPTWVEANDNAVGYYRVDYSHNLLNSVTEGNVEQRLNAPERVDFMGNAEALSTAGKLPEGDALGLIPRFHNDPERYVVESALSVALSVRSNLVPEDLMPNYQRFLRHNFDERARQLGWTPKPDEPDNVRLLRPDLVPAMATTAGDEQLADEGKKLAQQWLDNPDSINPNMVSAVLDTGAYYGDQGLFEKYLAAFKKTNDLHEQQRLIRALAGFRNPVAIKTGMEDVVSGDINFMKGLPLLFAGQGQMSTRDMALDFMEAHFDQISAKRPTGGGFDAGAYFPQVGASYCSAEREQKLKTFFEPRMEKFSGGPRSLAQVLESINDCIAEKQAQQPSVEQFLKSY
jgi:alanyl aminopeptidase